MELPVVVRQVVRRKCIQYEGKLDLDHLVKLPRAFFTLHLDFDDDLSGMVQRGLLGHRADMREADLHNILDSLGNIKNFRGTPVFTKVVSIRYSALHPDSLLDPQ